MEISDMQETLLPEEAKAISKLGQWMNDLFLSFGVPGSLVEVIKLIVLLSLSIGIVILLLWLANLVIKFVIRKIHKFSNLTILNYAIENKVPYYLGMLAPYTFIRNILPVVFEDFPKMIAPLTKFADSYLVLVIIWSIVTLTKSFFNVLQEKPAFKNKPMRGYIQVISIFLYGFGAVTVFAIFTNQSPGVVLGTLGAASAITMLVFQDSIKGFVGGIQLTANNMVELGDWITMNKYGADGTVMDITLNTVKVQNFDKTITTIPTYAMISDSFQNWKGMVESGGRRTKKCIHIKQGTIRFMKKEELDKFRSKAYLDKLIKEKEEQYSDFDNTWVGENTTPVTNIDLYMAYALNYLKSHPKIAQNLTLLVRQLAPTTEGIPVEIYIFTATTKWADYEGIATDVINHLVAMVSVFDLKVYEILSDTAES